MISSVVPYIDTLLGLSLITAAAIIHVRRRRRHSGRVRHRVRVRLPKRPHSLHFRTGALPVPLATAGFALIVAGWLWPADPATDSTSTSGSSPEPAAVQVVNASGRGVVLVRGTPTDDDTATEDAIRTYSERLGALVVKTLARPPSALDLAPRAIDAEQWKTIHDDPERARDWCPEADHTAFVAVIGIAALRLENGAGFAPWREPDYLVVSCSDPRHASLRGRVDERLGDRVPYEQAIVDDLKSALGKLARRPD
jgi:hypothetical protein